MSAIFMATATVRMGQTTRDKDGNVIKHTPPACEFDPKGGSVVVGKLKITDDGMEPDGPADAFGDWDAAGYLARVLEILKPARKLNIPNLRKIVRDAAADGDADFICEHCGDANCRDCIITQWREEFEEEAETWICAWS